MPAERKVLVVDDETTICMAVADCLEDLPGMEVECAFDDPAGLKMLQAESFDLALTDVELPDLSGLEVALAAVNDNVPVLTFSGHPDTTARLAAADCPHLEKPFRLADLLRESQYAIASSRENVLRVRASLEKLIERAEAVHAGLNESRRLLGQSLDQLARK